MAVEATRTTADRRRARARVTGTVQGVGFRPFVFRLAEELGMVGWVRNDERGVLLEVEGGAEAVEELVARVASDAPPLAAVESVSVADIPVRGEPDFRIVESQRSGEPDAPVSPDTATCAECLAEVRDPADRRHRYPFTNCTNCGPRFTIVRGIPYDRPRTTMAGFEMCEACRSEYDDPHDRRFHAQPNACPRCGPRASLADPAGRELALGDHRDAVEAAAGRLAEGAIVAVKGLGGYHLACRAADEHVVTALRSRKHREDRPFALMAPDLAAARELVELTALDADLLTSPARPIVIARRRPGARVAPSVAPRSRDLGVMLPYSALHHVLLEDVGETVVMTSGNVSDEPIAYEDADARRRLAGIADVFLTHDRPIHVRTDDSVVRTLGPHVRRAPLLIRRSRGFVPGEIGLPKAAPRPVLGCGAELKNAFCLAKGDRAWVGHHIGDLRTWDTLASFRAGIEHFARVFAVEPAVVAHDLHPDYLSTRHAQELDDVELMGVQHHHAHFAACLAEHRVSGPAIGAIFDGSGHGPDGTVWGGELLAGDAASFERVGSLLAVRLPGGDAAVREPWRMACAWLVAATEEEVPAMPSALRGAIPARRWSTVAALARGAVGSPVTTSAGRLFDAIAALCGVRLRVSHEGQAAAELEGIADARETGTYPLPVLDGERIVIDPRETVRAVAVDAAAGEHPAAISARFHNALAGAIATSCAAAAARAGTETVVLSGGVFQNRLLVERAVARLHGAGLRPLIPELLPPNDGGISYGQVAVATQEAAS